MWRRVSHIVRSGLTHIGLTLYPHRGSSSEPSMGMAVGALGRPPGAAPPGPPGSARWLPCRSGAVLLNGSVRSVACRALVHISRLWPGLLEKPDFVQEILD